MFWWSFLIGSNTIPFSLQLVDDFSPCFQKPSLCLLSLPTPPVNIIARVDIFAESKLLSLYFFCLCILLLLIALLPIASIFNRKKNSFWYFSACIRLINILSCSPDLLLCLFLIPFFIAVLYLASREFCFVINTLSTFPSNIYRWFKNK